MSSARTACRPRGAPAPRLQTPAPPRLAGRLRVPPAPCLPAAGCGLGATCSPCAAASAARPGFAVRVSIPPAGHGAQPCGAGRGPWGSRGGGAASEPAGTPHATAVHLRLSEGTLMEPGAMCKCAAEQVLGFWKFPAGGGLRGPANAALPLVPGGAPHLGGPPRAISTLGPPVAFGGHTPVCGSHGTPRAHSLPAPGCPWEPLRRPLRLFDPEGAGAPRSPRSRRGPR